MRTHDHGRSSSREVTQHEITSWQYMAGGAKQGRSRSTQVKDSGRTFSGWVFLEVVSVTVIVMVVVLVERSSSRGSATRDGCDQLSRGWEAVFFFNRMRWWIEIFQKWEGRREKSGLNEATTGQGGISPRVR